MERLNLRVQGEATIVEVAGEIELANTPRLREILGRACEPIDNRAPQVIVEMSGVSFIDSSGVGVLVGALKRARAQGGTLVLVGCGVRVRRVFEIAGLLDALGCVESLEAALEANSVMGGTT